MRITALSFVFVAFISQVSFGIAGPKTLSASMDASAVAVDPPAVAVTGWDRKVPPFCHWLSKADLDALVAQLNDDDWGTREAAQAALLEQLSADGDAGLEYINRILSSNLESETIKRALEIRAALLAKCSALPVPNETGLGGHLKIPFTTVVGQSGVSCEDSMRKTLAKVDLKAIAALAAANCKGGDEGEYGVYPKPDRIGEIIKKACCTTCGTAHVRSFEVGYFCLYDPNR